MPRYSQVLRQTASICWSVMACWFVTIRFTP